jgi:hypothetical protein
MKMPGVNLNPNGILSIDQQRIQFCSSLSQTGVSVYGLESDCTSQWGNSGCHQEGFVQGNQTTVCYVHRGGTVSISVSCSDLNYTFNPIGILTASAQSMQILVKNTGAVAVSSCQATSSDPQFYLSSGTIGSLQPGASAQLKLSLIAGSKSGRFSATVTVTCSNGVQGTSPDFSATINP